MCKDVDCVYVNFVKLLRVVWHVLILLCAQCNYVTEYQVMESIKIIQLREH